MLSLADRLLAPADVLLGIAPELLDCEVPLVAGAAEGMVAKEMSWLRLFTTDQLHPGNKAPSARRQLRGRNSADHLLEDRRILSCTYRLTK